MSETNTDRNAGFDTKWYRSNHEWVSVLLISHRLLVTSYLSLLLAAGHLWHY